MKNKVLNTLRRIYKSQFNLGTSFLKSKDLVNLRIQSFNELLAKCIIDGTPFMVSRFGSGELNHYLKYKISTKPTLYRYLNYIKCFVDTYDRNQYIIDTLTIVPKSVTTTKHYVSCIDKATRNIDILGSWLRQEQSPIIRYNPNIKFVELHHLEPFYFEPPWTYALESKKVLVVHPMKDSILHQYKRKDYVFKTKKILPDFHLEVLPAIWFNDPRFHSWAEILDYYYEEIEKYDFDVAIIGCSSWGMPLASKVKEMGKVAIHLGGATQLLFGILGDRWLDPSSRFFKLNEKENLINEHWIRPKTNEKPNSAHLIENGQNPYW